MNASHATYRGDVREHQGAELNAKYHHEVNRSILQNDTPKARYPRESRRHFSPGFDYEYQEGRGVCNIERDKC